MVEDLEMWHKFLSDQSAYCRTFSDFEVIHPNDIGFFMDSSRNFTLGFGSFCGKSWMYGQWPEQYFELDSSIQYLELLAQVAGILAWGKNFRNQKVLRYCDNESVVAMINNMASTCCNCMVLIRILVLHILKINLQLSAVYVKSWDNEIADSLSRLQFERFHRLT